MKLKHLVPPEVLAELKEVAHELKQESRISILCETRWIGLR
jgi:hypothetical protein